jgi:hypothetical protein
MGNCASSAYNNKTSRGGEDVIVDDIATTNNLNGSSSKNMDAVPVGISSSSLSKKSDEYHKIQHNNTRTTFGFESDSQNSSSTNLKLRESASSGKSKGILKNSTARSASTSFQDDLDKEKQSQKQREEAQANKERTSNSNPTKTTTTERTSANPYKSMLPGIQDGPAGGKHNTPKVPSYLKKLIENGNGNNYQNLGNGKPKASKLNGKPTGSPPKVETHESQTQTTLEVALKDDIYISPSEMDKLREYTKKRLRESMSMTMSTVSPSSQLHSCSLSRVSGNSRSSPSSNGSGSSERDNYEFQEESSPCQVIHTMRADIEINISYQELMEGGYEFQQGVNPQTQTLMLENNKVDNKDKNLMKEKFQFDKEEEEQDSCDSGRSGILEGLMSFTGRRSDNIPVCAVGNHNMSFSSSRLGSPKSTLETLVEEEEEKLSCGDSACGDDS